MTIQIKDVFDSTRQLTIESRMVPFVISEFARIPERVSGPVSSATACVVLTLDDKRFYVSREDFLLLRRLLK